MVSELESFPFFGTLHC